jgi:hypothetical protein
MTVTCTIQPEPSLLTVRLADVITLEDLQRAVTFRKTAGAWQSPALVDASAATGVAFSFEDARRLAAYVADLSGELGHRGPTVLVAPSPVVYGIARMYQFCVEARCPSTRFEVVSSIEEAVAWLAARRA